jgi:xyloglucan-specific exo-beta-1,4-glucanase
MIMETRCIRSTILYGIMTVFMSVLPSSTFAWQNVKIGGGGGFVPNIIYSPAKPGLVYARTDMGGVYRLDSVSKTWIPLTDWVAPEKWNMLGGESFATDPVDPKICYFAAGTYTNDWTDMNGRILRSMDYGNTWQEFEMPFKFGGNMPGRGMGERLNIDPNSHNILYFGARSGNGLWKSINSGESWTRVQSFPATGDYIQDTGYAYTADFLGVVWIAFDKSSSPFGTPCERLFVGAAQKKGPTVFQSDDAGATWIAVADQPMGGPADSLHIMPHHGVLRDSLLFIPYCNKGGPYDGNYGEIWKYNFVSKTWTDISPHSLEKDEAWGTATLQKESPYFGYGGFAVDPQNPQIIMAASLNSWWPDAILFRSVDGGASWTKSFYWTSYPSAKFKYSIKTVFPWLNWGVTASNWPDVVQPKLGWMISGMAINPFNSNEMMYGTGATIYGTSNLTNWGDTTKPLVEFKSVAEGIEECAVLSLAVPATTGKNADVKLISGVGDIGGFTHLDLQSSTQMFQTPRFGNTSSLDYAELAPDQVVRVGKASPDKYETPINLANSADGGKTWNKIYTLDSTYAGGTVALSALGTSIVWAAVDKTPCGGSINGLKAVNLPKNAFVASDRVNDSAFYAFADSVFYSGTASAFAASPQKLPAKTCKLRGVPGKQGHVWIPAGTGGLWFTNDGGKSFGRIDSAKVQSADVVGFGKAAQDAAYPAIYITGKAAGKTGVFQSIDQGATWVRINDDAHQYGSIGYAITGDMRRYGIVFVATNGRGVVYHDVSSVARSAYSKVTVTKDLRLSRLGKMIVASGANSMKLFDVRGCLVRKGDADGKRAFLNISGLSHGLYIARLGCKIKTAIIY